MSTAVLLVVVGLASPARAGGVPASLPAASPSSELAPLPEFYTKKLNTISRHIEKTETNQANFDTHLAALCQLTISDENSTGERAGEEILAKVTTEMARTFDDPTYERIFDHLNAISSKFTKEHHKQIIMTMVTLYQMLRDIHSQAREEIQGLSYDQLYHIMMATRTAILMTARIVARHAAMHVAVTSWHGYVSIHLPGIRTSAGKLGRQSVYGRSPSQWTSRYDKITAGSYDVSERVLALRAAIRDVRAVLDRAMATVRRMPQLAADEDPVEAMSQLKEYMRLIHEAASEVVERYPKVEAVNPFSAFLVESKTLETTKAELILSISLHLALADIAAERAAETLGDRLAAVPPPLILPAPQPQPTPKPTPAPAPLPTPAPAPRPTPTPMPAPAPVPAPCPSISEYPCVLDTALGPHIIYANTGLPVEVLLSYPIATFDLARRPLIIAGINFGEATYYGSSALHIDDLCPHGLAGEVEDDKESSSESKESSSEAKESSSEAKESSSEAKESSSEAKESSSEAKDSSSAAKESSSEGAQESSSSSASSSDGPIVGPLDEVDAAGQHDILVGQTTSEMLGVDADGALYDRNIVSQVHLKIDPRAPEVVSRLVDLFLSRLHQRVGSEGVHPEHCANSVCLDRPIGIDPSKITVGRNKTETLRVSHDGPVVKVANELRTGLSLRGASLADMGLHARTGQALCESGALLGAGVYCPPPPCSPADCPILVDEPSPEVMEPGAVEVIEPSAVEVMEPVAEEGLDAGHHHDGRPFHVVDDSGMSAVESQSEDAETLDTEEKIQHAIAAAVDEVVSAMGGDGDFSDETASSPMLEAIPAEVDPKTGRKLTTLRANVKLDLGRLHETGTKGVELTCRLNILPRDGESDSGKVEPGLVLGKAEPGLVLCPGGYVPCRAEDELKEAYRMAAMKLERQREAFRAMLQDMRMMTPRIIVSACPVQGGDGSMPEPRGAIEDTLKHLIAIAQTQKTSDEPKPEAYDSYSTTPSEVRQLPARYRKMLGYGGIYRWDPAVGQAIPMGVPAPPIMPDAGSHVQGPVMEGQPPHMRPRLILLGSVPGIGGRCYQSRGKVAVEGTEEAPQTDAKLGGVTA